MDLASTISILLVVLVFAVVNVGQLGEADSYCKQEQRTVDVTKKILFRIVEPIFVASRRGHTGFSYFWEGKIAPKTYTLLVITYIQLLICSILSIVSWLVQVKWLFIVVICILFLWLVRLGFYVSLLSSGEYKKKGKDRRE